MSMGRRKEQRQEALWIASAEVARSPGNPFYERLNGILKAGGFDAFVEGLCEKFYAEGKGRPGIEPGVYFRML